MNLKYIEVTQPLGTFFLCKVSAERLLSAVDILRRGMSDEERRNVQRQLDPRRQIEIADYLRDPDATFPTSIIVAAYPDAVVVHEQACELEIPEDSAFGEVIDGQHRLEGLRLAIAKFGAEIPELRTFELPVAVMTDLTAESKAYVFSIINSKQTRVSSSLIADLFGLRDSPSPTRTCHQLAEAFNAKIRGPFYRGIKMLGRRESDTEILSQGAFVKYLLEQLISKKPDEDALLLKESKPLPTDPSLPLRQFFIAGNIDFIGKILDNYFSAIREEFPLEWSKEPKKYMLRKTAGFLALVMVFRQIWPQIERSKDTSEEKFRAFAKQMREKTKDVPLVSQKFPSSAQGAKQLANYLMPDNL